MGLGGIWGFGDLGRSGFSVSFFSFFLSLSVLVVCIFFCCSCLFISCVVVLVVKVVCG